MARGGVTLVVAGVLLAGALSRPAPAVAGEHDLYAGLAYLRAGDQRQSAESFTRYCRDEANRDACRRVLRVLPLLDRPLSQDLRDYLAVTIEEQARVRSASTVDSRRATYWSRIFPVFP
jgi:hypothetical protein